MEPARTDPKKPKPSNTYLQYSSLGLQLFGAIGLSAWAGHKLDQNFAFQFPVFLLTFVLGTFAGMMVMVYKSINKH
jgi:hypothetical protein